MWAALPFVVGALAVVAHIAGEAPAIALGALFFLLGTAHGAGDEQDGEIRRFGLWSALAYIVAGLAIAAFFAVMPLAGLTLFLALSTWHFARSDDAVLWRGVAFAALATGGSMLFRFDETAAIFAALVGEQLPLPWLYAWAAVGVVGVACAAIRLWKHPRDFPIWLTLGAVAFLHPVLAVGTAFLVGHALPLQREQIDRYGARAVAMAQAPTTILAIIGAAGVAAAWLNGWLPLTLMAAIAFGFTTPHMLAERLER
ncbi:Brp/Blh family beta-carotene 15,15'-dioxygenase [Aurantiacibacter gangjinensis]|uniref:Brp/Blh family beta-carotene 15,15'-dioxygenase n=1 Tax=Aurantiacibacter gangjinensis TaxID=502682 RepID=UPI00138FAB25|nr:Brp/Blh family beta-carotene 15,15'-dioxygenase [Aurantiacibacter gangjinensis]